MAFDYDLCVIGAGSGGVRAARMSAGKGAKVAIAEADRIGGTCVIRGCIPKKLFVYASHYRQDFADAAGFGWQGATPQFNWPVLIANKDKEIERLSRLYTNGLQNSGVKIFKSHASLLDNHQVQLADRVITADKILLAPGAVPFRPDIAGMEYAITSDEAFHLPALPEKIIIVGGGYIAVEFAGIFNGLGVETTLIYRGQAILNGFDDDVRQHVQDAMQQQGINIKCNMDVAEIALSGGIPSANPDGTPSGNAPDNNEAANASGNNKTTGRPPAYEVIFRNGEKQTTDCIMYATGRIPNTQNLGLAQAGVEVNEKGAIIVDDYSQTNIKNIYAVGDVTSRMQLTPIAISEGAAFAETVFNNNPQKTDYSLIPTAVFSIPPVGTIGLTEAAARQKYDIDVYRSVFQPLKHSLSGNKEKMLMKMLVDKKTDRVLGLHIVGANSDEMIQAFAVAIGMGASKAQFDQTLAVHPTAAEELVTMKTPLA